MADTIRTKAALVALLADNTSGDISPQDVRDFLVSVMGVFGSIYVKDGSTAQGSLGTTQTKMTGFAADGPSDGTTPAHGSDQITIDNDGTYEISFDNSFSGTANAEFKFHLRVDGVEAASGACSRKIGAGGDVGNCGFRTQLALTATDVVTVYIETDNALDGDSMTPEFAHLTVKRIG